MRPNSSTIERVNDEHIIISFNICNCTTHESNRNNTSHVALPIVDDDGNDKVANLAVILLLLGPCDDDDDDEDGKDDETDGVLVSTEIT